MNISRVCVYRATFNVVAHKRSASDSGGVCCPKVGPQHLICFKQWTEKMVTEVIYSAINLKYKTKMGQRMPILDGAKIMTLQEVNHPVLSLAVSKAASILGADDVTITDQIVWDHDYNGKVFSYMSDAIFVSTATHTCLQRFADKAHVPVLCMQSRTHATIQALATIMAIFEEFSTMKGQTIGWLGPAHPVLNSYLLLCPMLGANIKFKCCCDQVPVSPLLKKASEDMLTASHTTATDCKKREEVFKDASVVIAGPTTTKPENLKIFNISLQDIETSTCREWIFFHTCPRGKEADDQLFYHSQSRTYDAFENLHFIAAALMAYVIKGSVF